jgi:hypothetical protein
LEGGGGETEKGASKYKEPPRNVPQENGAHHHLTTITILKHHYPVKHHGVSGEREEAARYPDNISRDL